MNVMHTYTVSLLTLSKISTAMINVARILNSRLISASGMGLGIGIEYIFSINPYHIIFGNVLAFVEISIDNRFACIRKIDDNWR